MNRELVLHARRDSAYALHRIEFVLDEQGDVSFQSSNNKASQDELVVLFSTEASLADYIKQYVDPEHTAAQASFNATGCLERVMLVDEHAVDHREYE